MTHPPTCQSNTPQPLLGGRNDRCGLCSTPINKIDNEELRTGLNCVLCPDCYWNSTYYTPRQVRLVTADIIVDGIEFRNLTNSPFRNGPLGPMLLGTNGNVPASHQRATEIFNSISTDGIHLLLAALANVEFSPYIEIQSDHQLLSIGFENTDFTDISRYISRPFILKDSALIYNPEKTGLSVNEIRTKLQTNPVGQQQSGLEDF